ncbi:MAG: lactonase family protein [Kiritimatiellaeota bacterium]|nr:lactonase family protein [Kiritimatiellota bacterium]
MVAGVLAGCVAAHGVTVALRDQGTGEPLANVRVDQYRSSWVLSVLNQGCEASVFVASERTGKDGTVTFKRNFRSGTYEVHSDARSPFHFEVNGNGKGIVVKPPNTVMRGVTNTFHIVYRDNGDRLLCEVVFCEKGSDERFAYVGTCTEGGDSKGIYRIRVDERTGAVSAPELVAEVDNPSFIAFNSNREYLYAVSESANKVLAYAVGDERGMLTLVNEVETGARPVHLVAPWGGEGGWGSKKLAVAHYDGGSADVWRLWPDGRIGTKIASYDYDHASTATDRQGQSRPQGVTFSHPGDFLVLDFGADRAYVYNDYTQKVHSHAPWIELPPGSGPRRAVGIGASGRVYILNELSNAVSFFTYQYTEEKGYHFALVEEVSTLPEGFDGESAATEMIVGGYWGNWQLYVANRGHDSIARFQIEKETGRPTFMECTPCGGKGPRHLAIMPSAPWMLVANQDSNAISLLRIGKDGALTLVPDGGVPIAAPTCVVFEHAQ